MSKIRITKEFRFEMAHALYGYDGPCKNVHGHSYQLSVTLLGEPNQDQTNVKYGMVMDFTDLKAIVNREVIDVFDHALVVNGNTPHAELANQKQWAEKIILADYQPSCENLLIDFVQRIKRHLPANIELITAQLRETATSYAEWHAQDQA